MQLPRIIGPHPLDKDGSGKLKIRIATAFPADKVLVTEPCTTHAMQRLHYADVLDQERLAHGASPLSSQERHTIWEAAVDLIIEQEMTSDADGKPRLEDKVLIRPDPDRMPLAFAADEFLRELAAPVDIQQVGFLAVQNPQVRQAIKVRGQCWRMAPAPLSSDHMCQTILAAKTGIAGQKIYYHNKTSGTRFLTCTQFAQLGILEPAELKRHLAEIQDFAAQQNRWGNPEVTFFLASRDGFSKETLAPYDFLNLEDGRLKTVHEELVEEFRNAVPPDLRDDNLDSEAWRNRMFSTLSAEREQAVPQETLLGLSPEYFMQIDWSPGVRFENGELLPDPYFHEQGSASPRRPAYDKTSLAFIFNFVREFGGLEYANIGRVIGSLSRARESQGRRDVYIAVLKPAHGLREIVKIVRMQKYGVREHLDEGKDLLQAMREAELYTEYVLDRRLACRQLGMNLTQQILAQRIPEIYRGQQTRYHGERILSPYFERDYIHGIASDKIPASRFQDEVYCLQFAKLLGQAAAPNLILGRVDRTGKVVFYDGDEIVVEYSNGLPAEIALADQLGTFGETVSDLVEFAAAYAKPVNDRAKVLVDPGAFAEVYTQALQERFAEIQGEYRKRRSAYDALLRDRDWGPDYNIAARWAEVLRRLDETDPQNFTQQLRSHLKLC